MGSGVGDENAESCRAFSGAEVQAPWHGVTKTVRLHCDEAQQLDACEDWKVVRWCRTQASSHNSKASLMAGLVRRA